MKTKFTILPIAFLTAASLLASCSMGKGDRRDSIGNRIERNARVTTNDDCSEVFTWEDLDSSVLGETKQKVSDKLEEKGINLDGSLIDALIELKKH